MSMLYNLWLLKSGQGRIVRGPMPYGRATALAAAVSNDTWWKKYPHIPQNAPISVNRFTAKVAGDGFVQVRPV
jgi:hypothetical protein